MQHFPHYSNTGVSQTSLDAVVREIRDGVTYDDFWMDRYEDEQRQPAFEPLNSNYHDDRCCCPGCSGLCQDDFEFYAGTGQYAAGVEVEP